MRLLYQRGKEKSMNEQKATNILEDAIRVWNELLWFNQKHEGEAHLYIGDEIQLCDESICGGIGSLAEDIADALHLTRKYYPVKGGGLCSIEYKGYKFFSGWREN